ncbi:Tripartite tricarboxylate transporter family receptor [compost metagenome]
MPTGTPRALVNRLNGEIVKVLASADVKEKFFSMGMEAIGGTPEELTARVKADVVRMGKVIRDAGIKN